jgi:hypothetical protein
MIHIDLNIARGYGIIYVLCPWQDRKSFGIPTIN